MLELTNRMGNTDQQRVVYNSVATQTEGNLDDPNVRAIPAGAEGPSWQCCAVPEWSDNPWGIPQLNRWRHRTFVIGHF